MGLLDIFGTTNKENNNTLTSDQIYDKASQELKDLIAPAGLKIESQSINLSGKTVKSFFVISYPRYLDDSWLAPLINLDKIFNVSLHITPLATTEMMKKFQKKVAEVESQIFTKQEKYDKAIQVYEKLILKYPEKSSKFATQIEKIKKLI